jgi:hypothetical protein
VNTIPTYQFSIRIQNGSLEVSIPMEANGVKLVLQDGIVYGVLANDSGSVDVTTEKPNLANACLKACQRRNLPKETTIRREVKLEIAKEIGLRDTDDYNSFKPGTYAYQTVGKLMSEAGYSRKPKKESRDR